jgi:hypothetical protein
MDELLRRFIFVSLLTLQAMVSLCGQGHHALHDLADRVIGTDEAHLPDDSGAVVTAQSEGLCPLCGYFAVVVLPVPVETPALPERVECLAPAPAPDRSERPAFLLACPRAPPLS